VRPGSHSPAARRHRPAGASIPILILALILAVSCGRRTPDAPADLTLTYSAADAMDPSHPWAEAVAVAAGKIVSAGSATEAPRFRIPASEIHTARVLLTLFEGREIDRDPAL